MSFRWLLSMMLLWFIPIACGPSVEEMEKYVDERMKHTIEGLPAPLPTATPMTIPTSVPTVTPVSFPTPLPTATPMTIPTSVPTVTPVSFPTPLPHITPTPYRWEGLWPVVRVKHAGGRGNGVLISPNEILSAYHAVQTDSTITVTLPSSSKSAEEVRVATLVGFNIQDDIALLSVNPFSYSSNIDYPKLPPNECQKAVNNGDVVVVETTGNHPTSNGVLRLWGKRSAGWGDGRRFITDLDLAPGLSGSPVYNFTGRYLVGLVLQGSSLLSNRLSGIALDGCIIKERLPELRSGAKN